MNTTTFARPSSDGQTISVDVWPSEKGLAALMVLVALVLWVLLVISIVGIIYAIVIAVFFFMSQVAFIAYLRGSAVRLGPDQFPELYHRVVALSHRAGLFSVPEVYLMQAGGSLNALATKLFASNFVVLYSDLLEACGDNTEARDMIIGHELGHHKEQHLTLIWFLAPALIIPFLGSAYSRAREYTCDRYGYALAGANEEALRGLAILAAGAEHGPKVDLKAFVKQRESLNTGLMTIGAWLSTHPPLSDRIVALEPSYDANSRRRVRGTVLALIAVVIGFVVPVVFAIWGFRAFADIVEEAKSRREQESEYRMTISVEEATKRVNEELPLLAAVVEEYRTDSGGKLPPTPDALSEAWKKYRPRKAYPWDPFDGYYYGYYISNDDSTEYVLWSVGPDLEGSSDDDILYHSSDHAGQSR